MKSAARDPGWQGIDVLDLQRAKLMVDGINLSCNVVALNNRGQRVTDRRLGSPGRRSLPRRRPAVNGGLP